MNSELFLNAADGGENILVVVLVSGAGIGDACEVGPGIVILVAGPETCAGILVGEFAVVVLEAGELEIESGGVLEGIGVLVGESGPVVFEGRERPAGGAEVVIGGVPGVESAGRLAVCVVVVVAGAGIGNVDGHVFGGPDLVGDLDSFVDLVGARKRVGSFVVVAGVGLFAGGKGGYGAQGGGDGRDGLEDRFHKYSFVFASKFRTAYSYCLIDYLYLIHQ